MDQPYNPHPGHFHHRHRNLASIITVVVIVILVAAAAGYLALNWHGVPTVTSNQSFSVPSGQSVYFKLPGSSYTYALYVKNSTGAYSTIYVSKVPVLTSPIITFVLVNGESANISASGSSQNANIEVKLVSSTSKEANIKLIPIPSLFTIKVSSLVQVRNPASFYAANNSTPITIPLPPANTTNSTKKNTTTNKTTVTPPPKVVATPLENISTVLNTTYIGTLMKNYKALYLQDTSCTSQTYGTDIQVYAQQQPVGPFDFANASAVTPTNLLVNVTARSKTNYYVTYTPVTPIPTFPGPAVTFNFDSASGVVTNITFSGIYLDQNYTTLNKNYEFQDGIGNNCGAYVP